LAAFARISGKKENANTGDTAGYLAFETDQTSDNTLQERMRITSTGNVGIGTISPTNILSIGGNVARTIWMERHTTANTAGNDLTVQGGGATSGATDKSGGMVVLKPGLSTGTGKGSIRFQRLTRASGTGTTDNTLVDAHIIAAEARITAEATPVSLFEIALPTLEMCGGSITFQIMATDGTNLAVHSGVGTFAAVNNAGTYVSQFTDAPTTSDADAATAGVGAIADTWAITSGVNKITISVQIAVSGMVANDIRIYYSIHSGGRNAVTQL
jgi:hypothetical protein